MIQEEIGSYKAEKRNTQFRTKLMTEINKRLDEIKVEVGSKTYSIPDEVYHEIANRVKRNFLSLIQSYEDAKKGR
tara:strand:+ start:356 stop:580 length:225 start_codon:yes stop_codon:yes gene_type:complete